MKVTFDNATNAFYDDVKRRVAAHFRERSVSPHANAAMVAKMIFFLAIPFGLLALLCTGLVPFAWSLPIWALIGLGLSGVGFNVAHDPAHGSLSSRRWVNELIGLTFELMGASSRTWAADHNHAHHTYTNIPSMDRDIDPGPLLTLYDGKKIIPRAHRYQFIYAWALYCLLSFTWILERDFTFLLRSNATLRQLPRVIATKALYGCIYIALPLALSGYTVGEFLIGFALMHACHGLSSSVIFQLAHVVVGVDFRHVSSGGDGKVDMPWAEHQMRTTANFGRTRLCTFLFGGLTHQIEHHLFPKVCHIHYPALAPIVKACAEEHGLPYVHLGSLFQAVASHQRALYRFARPELTERWRRSRRARCARPSPT